MPFERLSAQDAFFYQLEDADTPLHIAALALFDASSTGGALSSDDIRAVIATRLELLPRYRMRVIETPLTGHPVWADDRHFDVRHHVRFASLPGAAGPKELDEVVRGFLAERLDRGRPLWEVRVIEGLSEQRVAALFKAHHCLTDGASAVDMLLLLLSPQPSAVVPPPPVFTPRAEPTAFALLRGELDARAQLAQGVVDFARRAAREPGAAFGFLRARAEGIGQAAQAALRRGSATALNAALGPDRRLGTLRVELEDIKRIRRALGGTLNDVAVATVTGALSSYLEARGEPIRNVELRATIPMSTRSDVERGTLGNKLAALAAPLPIGERDRRRRFSAVRRTMNGLKGSKQALGVEVLNWIAEWTTPSLLTQGSRFALGLRSTHVMITNIRGPQDPLFCLGYPMLEAYPAPPLSPGQALTIGLLSYAGFLHFGLVADAGRLPDLDALVDALRTEIGELLKLAAES
jgi:diacylglycerol O-acyltransferase / wax synthase